MEALCSRQDFLGRIGRHYLGASRACEKSSRVRRGVQRPRVSLRPLGSYRTLLMVALMYLLFALFSFGLMSSTALILSFCLLYELLLSHKLKTQ